MSAKENEIHIIRVYDAPVSAVWDAWTDEKQVAQWWGPRGFSITTHSKSLKVGGVWDYTMHGPDGTDYENKTKYLEVEKHKKLVYDHGANDDRPPLFRVTVEFSEKNGRTTMDMRMALESAEAARETRKFIHKAGGNATWDRLAEYLTKDSEGKETFVISRSFPAPRELIFEMWTNPEHFSQWLAPKGFDMKFIRADIREGGSSFYKMASAGLTMYGQAFYEKLDRPSRLIYTQQFTDEQGNVSRHPLAPTWPETMRTVVDFAAEGPDATRVTVTWEVVGNYTPEELGTFIQGRTGRTMGWTGSFDKLDEYLAEKDSKQAKLA